MSVFIKISVREATVYGLHILYNTVKAEKNAMNDQEVNPFSKYAIVDTQLACIKFRKASAVGAG